MSQICPVPLSLENMNTLLRSELIIIIQHPGIFMYFDISHLPSVFSECDAFFISHRIGGHQSPSVLCVLCSCVADSTVTPWIVPTRLLCPWDSSGKNTGVGCHFLLQGIFPTQESELHLLSLLHCRWILFGFFFFAGEFFTAELLGKPLLSYIDRWIDFYIYIYI